MEGELSLQASPTASWYVNPTLREATDLQDRFGFMVGPAHYDGQPMLPLPQGGLTTVEDLSKENNPHDIWGNKYTVTAEIKKLTTDETWWYMSCKKCFHRSKPYGVQYRCTAYECDGTDAEPRYRLGLIVVDPGKSSTPDAPCVDLVCFGPVAEELVGTPVQTLIDSGAGSQGFLPPQIARLCGRQYQFTLSVPRAALRRDDLSFKIDSISVVLPITSGNQNVLDPAMQSHKVQASASADTTIYETHAALPSTQAGSSSQATSHDVDNTIAAQEEMPGKLPATESHTPPPAQTPECDTTARNYQPDSTKKEPNDKKQEKSATKRHKKGNVSRELFPEGSGQ